MPVEAIGLEEVTENNVFRKKDHRVENKGLGTSSLISKGRTKHEKGGSKVDK